jgi:hypothetical protein
MKPRYGSLRASIEPVRVASRVFRTKIILIDVDILEKGFQNTPATSSTAAALVGKAHVTCNTWTYK